LALGAVAASAGLALALLWLLILCVPRLARRLRAVDAVCLAAPVELILDRPG
jgi:hypothetical protein